MSKASLEIKEAQAANTIQGQMEPPLVYDPPGGTHIDHACKHAAALSINSGREVYFKFNDVDLIASPERSWNQLALDYNEICRIRAEEYHNSPKGKADAAHRAAEVSRKQWRVKNLLLRLPATLGTGNLDKAVQWVKWFTDPADDIAVNFDKKGLAQTFRAYGYRTNEYVGEDKDWFNTRERIGRYLIGQVMNCLENGMPPHPRSIYFCEKYFTRKAFHLSLAARKGLTQWGPLHEQETHSTLPVSPKDREQPKNQSIFRVAICNKITESNEREITF